MSRRRKTMLILGIIIAIIAISVLSIKIYLSSKENKAIQIAQEYLNQKYEQEMQYENTRFSWVDPSLYHIRFSPVSSSEVIFEVLVYPNITIPEDRWDFGQSKWSADNYYVKYFEYCMEEYLAADVKRIWSDNATVKVLDVNIGGVAFSVPPELNDKMILAEMESLVNDYWIYIDMHDTSLDTGALNLTANQIFEFIQIIKDNGFEPKTIAFWSSEWETEKGILFGNWDEIVSVDQIIKRLETELLK